MKAYGKPGPTLEISELEQLLDRSATRPGYLRLRKTRWGARTGAPPGTCTLIYGRYESFQALNVPTPQIPKWSAFKGPKGNEGVVAKGWFQILSDLLQWRAIRPTEEVQALVGEQHARSCWGGGCW